jgi:hypothetical protein
MKAASPTALTVLCCALFLPTAWGACGSTAAPPTVGSPSAGSGNVPGGAGSPTVPTAGADSGGAPAAGGAPAVVAGGSSVAGSSAIAGGGSTSTAGSSQGGSGALAGDGAGGAAAGSTSSGGTSGAPSGAAGAPADLVATVGGPLDGQMLLGPCLNDTAKSVCSTLAGACPPRNTSDPALSGGLTTNHKVTLGGDPTKTYTITLHVQGEVESKRYDNGKDQESQLASPKANGFCEGGTPTGGDAYNVYMVRVSNPKKDYFLNSLQTPGVSNHTTYGIDYTAKIQANGGAELLLVAADANCAMIKNCGPMENTGDVCAAPIVISNIDPKATAKNPSFNFTTAYNGQWIVMVVTAVVAN